jgi:lambda repressor-like predicted transcriptional regulator
MIEPYRARILAVLEQPKITKALLASLAGIHPNSLKDVGDPAWRPTTKTLESIMGAVERLEK